MGANGYTSSGVSPATLRQGLGWVPAAVPRGVDGVAVSGGFNPNLSADAAQLPVPSVTFGTGAPAGTPADNALYFDTTNPTYAGYVGHSGTWHPF